MSKTIQLKKGLNIKLVGEAEKVLSSLPLTGSFAIQPSDFIGVTPQLLIKQDDEVKAGTPLFCDKKNDLIKFCSPVSGEVIEIVRGEKRRILEIKILPDKIVDYVPFEKADPEKLSRDQIILALLTCGAWPLIRQRPFGTIADPKDKPKSIFVSAFDTNPLAPDNNFIISGNGDDFQTGLDALRKLTDGKVHLNIHANLPTSDVFIKSRGVQVNRISGPHPAGNVGVQIHHIDPVNKGDVVWCVAPQDVLIIGRLFNHGKFDASRIVAVTGSQVRNPKYYKTILGSSVGGLIEDAGIKDGQNRIISGNVLTGKRISPEGWLDFYATQVTVIPEGNEPEFMGWMAPGFNKLSMSRTFFSWLTPEKKFKPDTNLHGEERPFVVTGQYEAVFPMDIYPVQLLKSILIEDIELMENLGIYEVVEEDFALCEFVCTSKIESQRIIRKGLDLIRKEFT